MLRADLRRSLLPERDFGWPMGSIRTCACVVDWAVRAPSSINGAPTKSLVRIVVTVPLAVALYGDRDPCMVELPSPNNTFLAFLLTINSADILYSSGPSSYGENSSYAQLGALGGGGDGGDGGYSPPSTDTI